MASAGLYRYEYPRVSMEYFSPGPHSQTRTATTSSAIFNLVSTMIGGGILSLPYAFEKCGLIPALFLMLLNAAASNFSLYVIVSCSRRGGANSYEQIVRKALGPRAGFMSVILLVMLTFLVMVGYMILTKDLITALASYYVFNRKLTQSETVIVIMICSVCILPMLLFISVDSLRFTSVCSVCSMLLLIMAVTIRAWYDPTNATAVNTTTSSDFTFNYGPNSLQDLLFGFPIISVVYLGHFNVLPIYRSLIKPTRKRLKKFLSITVFSTWVVYMFLGMTGYIVGRRSRHNVPDNILNMFSIEDELVNTGRIGLLGTLLLSYPLLMQPCRSNLSRLYKYTQFGLVYERDEDLALLGKGIPRQIAESKDKAYSMLNILSTIAILSSAVSLALFVPGVSIIWNVMGSSVGLVIAYIFPCACYIRIRNKPITDSRMITAWTILLLSSVACIACCIVSVITVCSIH